VNIVRLFGPQGCAFVKPGGICRQIAGFQPPGQHNLFCKITANRTTVRGLIANDTDGNSSAAR
jgi:hypothetical protein